LSPVITRLYGPEAFGIMGTFTALTRIIIPIAALTYPIAIVLPKNDKNAKGLIKLSVFITIIITTIATLFLFAFQSKNVEVFILSAGFMQIIEQWLIRTNQFFINAKSNFMQSVITNVGKAGIGCVYPSAVVLVVLQALGNSIKALLMLFFTRKSDYKESNSLE